jgi:hypothetical protein
MAVARYAWFGDNFRSEPVAPDTDEAKSFSAILGRVADAVNPFGFAFVADVLLPPLFGGIRDGPGHRANLFEPLDNGHADKLQGVHWPRVRRFWVS